MASTRSTSIIDHFADLTDGRYVRLEVRDRGWLRSVTDCGAGGFSSAVGEMGEDIGARVQLEKAPLKYDGLSYTEIWISEADQDSSDKQRQRQRDDRGRLQTAHGEPPCEASNDSPRSSARARRQPS